MKEIHIYYGSDSDFDTATKSIDDFCTLGDVLNHIGQKELFLKGVPTTDPPKPEPPKQIKNLVIHTDDYGGVNEWALLGFSNNVLQHQKLDIENVWMNNPPKKIYDDIQKTYSSLVHVSRQKYENIDIETLKQMAEKYQHIVIGQDRVIMQVLSSLYSLKSSNRIKPVTILFLGESGVGKTETAKYLASFFNKEMVRVQFSMQQTSTAYQFIFGAEHGENSLARELIRRESNIILLDEFDKVHPSFYNAFYQMFDEGEFIDSNYSVDVSRCIIICTTNYMSEEEAEEKLGSPVYSRFSKVVKFSSISIADKMKIAANCYKTIFQKLDKDDQELIADNPVLSIFTTKIQNGYYRNMRMLKTDIEDAINYEILVARGILQK